MTSPTAPTIKPTPQWLLGSNDAVSACELSGKRKRAGAIEKTLDGGAGLMRQVLFSQDIAEEDGFLQRVSPGAKLLGLVLLLVSAALVHNIVVLVIAYALTLVAAYISAVPVRYFVTRVWLFVPIFTGIVVLPAIFSFVTPGDMILSLWMWNGQPVGVTAQGLRTAGLLVTRVALSISLVLLLTITTPWVELLAALRTVRVPRMFVLVVGMAYRYIFLLLGSVTDMFESRRARNAGRGGRPKSSRSVVFSTVGALLGKSHELSEEVHRAMVSRGFRGDAKTLDGAGLRGRDYVFFVAVTAVGVAVVVIDRMLGL